MRSDLRIFLRNGIKDHVPPRGAPISSSFGLATIERCEKETVDMATLINFYTPDEPELLAALGRVVINHSHLDHVLRLAIKRLLGISVDDEGYSKATGFMTAKLRKKVKEHAAERFGKQQPAVVNLIWGWVNGAEELSEERNRLVHGLWAIEPPAGIPHIREKGKLWAIPHVERLKHLADDIAVVHDQINQLTLYYTTGQRLA